MELGASRVVPARELSLSEIRSIHDNCKHPDGSSIEIEAFIHGAMCYCYSGTCLFSSMVGERSGNRGRCAQPCRLPYRSMNSDDCYPLSLKDMCMADRIPELIEAGIDSFKIEGRMKKPEYAAGVTSIYRKIIDRYYELSGNDSFEKEKINIKTNSDDRRILSSLYLRSEIGEGYYFRHNGSDMITLKNPAYNGSEESVLDQVRSKYITGEKKILVKLKCCLAIGKKAELTLSAEDSFSVTVYGDEVQAALKRAMSKEDVEKQLTKFGNTYFEIENLDINIDDDGIFMPNKALNDLRRMGVSALEDEIIKGRGYNVFAENAFSDDIDKICSDNANKAKRVKGMGYGFGTLFAVSVMTYEQLDQAIKFAKDSGKVSRVYIDSRILMLGKEIPSNMGYDFEYFVALPYITRNESFYNSCDEVRKILSLADDNGFRGVLVRNSEQLKIIKDFGYKGTVVTDYGLYLWNHEAVSLHREILKDNRYDGFNLPLELNLHEAGELLDAVYADTDSASGNNEMPEAGFMLYGRVPMMLTANCIRNTLKGCSGNRGSLCEYEKTKLTDRTGRVLPVTYDCTHCTNIIWNSVPVSLFKKLRRIKEFASNYKIAYRVDFTVEDAKEVREILDSYCGLLYGNESDNDRYEKALSMGGYTAGHFERSAD